MRSPTLVFPQETKYSLALSDHWERFWHSYARCCDWERKTLRKRTARYLEPGVSCSAIDVSVHAVFQNAQ